MNNNIAKAIEPKPEFSAPEILERAYKIYPKDPYAAKALVLTTVALFPESFDLQWQAYKWEKGDGNIKQAAKIFRHLINNFPTQDSQEFSNEICAITSAIRNTDKENAKKHESYVYLFEQLDSEVQQSLLLLTVDYTDSLISQINLLFLILNRYSYATHYVQAEALMELLADGISTNKTFIQRLIIEEALPLLERLKPRLTVGTVSRILNICLEYHIRRVVDNERKPITNELWRRVFELLSIFAGIMNWQKFMPFNPNLEYSVYWDKLLNIMSITPAGSTCVLYYASVLYLYTLHCYIQRCNTIPEDDHVNHILMEGIPAWSGGPQSREPIFAIAPQITPITKSSEQISRAFVQAAQCWQLLNTEQFQRDFSKLVVALQLGNWIPRFLFDLSLYFAHRDEANLLLNEFTVKSSLVHHLQKITVMLLSGGISPMCFEYIVKVMSELPKRQGSCIRHSVELNRHMIFLPLEQRAIVQYCARALVDQMSLRYYNSSRCPIGTVTRMLVLLQAEYPRDTMIADELFKSVASRREFFFHSSAPFMVNINFLEQILHIYNTSSLFKMDFGRKFGKRSIGDKEFRALIKQQIESSHEDPIEVIVKFIVQEKNYIFNDLFNTELVAVNDDDDVQYIDTIPLLALPSSKTDMSVPPPLHPLTTTSMTTNMILPEYLPNGAVAVPMITGTLPPPLTAVPVGVITPTPIAQLALPSPMDVTVPALVANVPVIALPPPASPDAANSTTEMMQF